MSRRRPIQLSGNTLWVKTPPQETYTRFFRHLMFVFGNEKSSELPILAFDMRSVTLTFTEENSRIMIQRADKKFVFEVHQSRFSLWAEALKLGAASTDVSWGSYLWLRWGSLCTPEDWKKRWFVLDNRSLMYWMKREDVWKPPLGKLALKRGQFLLEKVTGDKTGSFRIKSKSKSFKGISLVGDTEDLSYKWLEAACFAQGMEPEQVPTHSLYGDDDGHQHKKKSKVIKSSHPFVRMILEASRSGALAKAVNSIPLDLDGNVSLLSPHTHTHESAPSPPPPLSLPPSKPSHKSSPKLSHKSSPKLSHKSSPKLSAMSPGKKSPRLRSRSPQKNSPRLGPHHPDETDEPPPAEFTPGGKNKFLSNGGTRLEPGVYEQLKMESSFVLEKARQRIFGALGSSSPNSPRSPMPSSRPGVSLLSGRSSPYNSGSGTPNPPPSAAPPPPTTFALSSSSTTPPVSHFSPSNGITPSSDSTAHGNISDDTELPPPQNRAGIPSGNLASSSPAVAARVAFSSEADPTEIDPTSIVSRVPSKSGVRPRPPLMRDMSMMFPGEDEYDSEDSKPSVSGAGVYDSSPEVSPTAATSTQAVFGHKNFPGRNPPPAIVSAFRPSPTHATARVTFADDFILGKVGTGEFKFEQIPLPEKLFERAPVVDENLRSPYHSAPARQLPLSNPTPPLPHPTVTVQSRDKITSTPISFSVGEYSGRKLCPDSVSSPNSSHPSAFTPTNKIFEGIAPGIPDTLPASLSPSLPLPPAFLQSSPRSLSPSASAAAKMERVPVPNLRGNDYLSSHPAVTSSATDNARTHSTSGSSSLTNDDPSRAPLFYLPLFPSNGVDSPISLPRSPLLRSSVTSRNNSIQMFTPPPVSSGTPPILSSGIPPAILSEQPPATPSSAAGEGAYITGMQNRIQNVLENIEKEIWRQTARMASPISHVVPIELNVRGEIFTTSVKTLGKFPQSLLGYISRCVMNYEREGDAENFKTQIENAGLNFDQNNRICLDLDPRMFDVVLEFLRTGVVPTQLDENSQTRRRSSMFSVAESLGLAVLSDALTGEYLSESATRPRDDDTEPPTSESGSVEEVEYNEKDGDTNKSHALRSLSPLVLHSPQPPVTLSSSHVHVGVSSTKSDIHPNGLVHQLLNQSFSPAQLRSLTLSPEKIGEISSARQMKISDTVENTQLLLHAPAHTPRSSDFFPDENSTRTHVQNVLGVDGEALATPHTDFITKALTNRSHGSPRGNVEWPRDISPHLPLPSSRPRDISPPLSRPDNREMTPVNKRSVVVSPVPFRIVPTHNGRYALVNSDSNFFDAASPPTVSTSKSRPITEENFDKFSGGKSVGEPSVVVTTIVPVVKELSTNRIVTSTLISERSLTHEDIVPSHRHPLAPTDIHTSHRSPQNFSNSLQSEFSQSHASPTAGAPPPILFASPRSLSSRPKFYS